jgi:hypothetical protein
MFRCVPAAIAAIAFCTVATSASAQIARNFTRDTLRGDLVLGIAPEASLNGKPARLSPGARIHGTNQMLVLPGTIVGQKFKVHYLQDNDGLIREVWILRPDEAAKQPWPATRQEAQTWGFDYNAQRWTKP